MEDSTAASPSFYQNEELSVGNLELNKKRKSQSELDLPSPKHKFRDRSSNSAHGSPVAQNSEAQKDPKNRKKGITGTSTADVPEKHEESDEDSNDFIEGSDSNMILDDNTSKQSSTKTYSLDHPSTSYGSMNSDAFKNVPYSLDSRHLMGGKTPKITDTDPCNTELEDTEYLHHEYMISGSGHGCADFNGPATENAILYSNGLLSNEFIVSSESWGIEQDAQLRARKPTIDQEFEQYFSMLML